MVSIVKYYNEHKLFRVRMVCLPGGIRLQRATKGPFTDSVDQNQTGHNVQSDLGSTLSDEEICTLLK